MIQQAFSAMMTMMLAKFILNDLPHAAGLVGVNPSRNPPVLAAAAREGAAKEAEWGVEVFGRKKWAEDLWGKVTNGNVTLFHGTSEYLLSDILAGGLQPSYAGWGYELGEVEELPQEERPSPAVWLAYTPYLAFFFGNVAVQVTIPLSWIAEANDGVLVERAIPPAKIDSHLLIGDWE